MTCPKCRSTNTSLLRGKTSCNSCGALTETYSTWGQAIAHTLTGRKPEPKETT